MINRASLNFQGDYCNIIILFMVLWKMPRARARRFFSSGLGFGLETQKPGLGLESYASGLGLETCGLGLEETRTRCISVNQWFHLCIFLLFHVMYPKLPYLAHCFLLISWNTLPPLSLIKSTLSKSCNFHIRDIRWIRHLLPLCSHSPCKFTCLQQTWLLQFTILWHLTSKSQQTSTHSKFIGTLAQTLQNINTSHQLSKNYTGFQSNKESITSSVFSHTKHLQINNLHIFTIVFHFRHILSLQDLLIHSFFPFHMSDHHLAKGLSLSLVHDFGIHYLPIPEIPFLYQYSVPS